MIDARQSDLAEVKGRGVEILSEFRALMPGAAVVQEPPAKRAEDEGGMLHADSGKRQITYRIRLRPSPRLFADGTNPISLMNELRRLGECRIVAQSEEVPFLDEIDPEQCYTRWDAVLTTDRDVNAIRDVFIFIEDQCELKIETIDDGTTSLEETDYRKLGEILVEKRDLSEEDLGRVLRDRQSLGRKSLGEILVEEGLVAPLTVEAALVEQEHVRELRERRLREEVISSLRVSSEKLDRLVNLVGELVTVQARLTQSAADRDDPGLVSIAEEVERLTADLRDNTMSIRLLPLGTTFSKFKRLVRDLSLKLGKETR
jgi:two-component system chemotaxis sensor kinase CheA